MQKWIKQAKITGIIHAGGECKEKKNNKTANSVHIVYMDKWFEGDKGGQQWQEVWGKAPHLKGSASFQVWVTDFPFKNKVYFRNRTNYITKYSLATYLVKNNNANHYIFETHMQHKNREPE